MNKDSEFTVTLQVHLGSGDIKEARSDASFCAILMLQQVAICKFLKKVFWTGLVFPILFPGCESNCKKSLSRVNYFAKLLVKT